MFPLSKGIGWILQDLWIDVSWENLFYKKKALQFFPIYMPIPQLMEQKETRLGTNAYGETGSG